uniref:hypothetical protein n=1 Tax=Methylobacterium sp. B34 TaxID=95563 RepID=UPI00034A7DB5|nr:hypothetical protein [Methylobacterium sp. B34]
MRKTVLAAAVLAAFGAATSASAAPGLPASVSAPSEVISVRMDRMHGHHHHRMMRHHRHGHMMRHHHHRGHMMRHMHRHHRM